MKLMTKGEKNETKALWVLSEPVRRLMYGRADAAEGELRGEAGVGAVMGLAEVSWQAGHRGEEKEQKREEEQACKLCDDYQKTQGPSVLHLPGLGGTGLGP